jgi:hypothetical protein
MSDRTRRVMRLHQWTDEDLEALGAAVADSMPMLDHYRAHGYPESDWWSHVSGDLRARTGGRVAVTGLACRRAWDRVREAEAARREAEARVVVEPDAWEAMAALIDEYEATRLERVDDTVARIESHVQAMRIVIDHIAAELWIHPTETWEVEP